MPEFFTEFATAYPALQQRCGPATRINLETLQGVQERELLRRIGDRITDMFRTAYEDAPDDSPVLKQNLQLVAEETVKHTMAGTGTRRLMVKTWVRALQQFRQQQVTPLTADDAQKLMDSARQELDASDKEAVASAGE
jgi:hypothetical protein